MMQTTLRKIRGARPCGMHLENDRRTGYLKLRHGLGKDCSDDEPIDITTIVEINGLDDAMWCLRTVDGHDREIRLYAVWCVRRIELFLKDPKSLIALDVAERYANGAASDEERVIARDNAKPASPSAARAAAYATT